MAEAVGATPTTTGVTDSEKVRSSAPPELVARMVIVSPDARPEVPVLTLTTPVDVLTLTPVRAVGNAKVSADPM